MTDLAPGAHAETVGEAAHLFTAAHPPRKDSPEYVASRKVLMNTRKGGCIVCGGLPDLSHPELATVADPKGAEDHHGGGLYVKDILVGLNLIGLEWSLGWSADPVIVAAHVANLNIVFAALGEPTFDDPITDTASVMGWVDSTYNANVKICAVHHRATQHQASPDANGNEGVGIHEIPFPIWLGQITCEWSRFNMWAGTSGHTAVAPDPNTPGGVVVLHHAHPDMRGASLAPGHPLAAAAHRRTKEN